MSHYPFFRAWPVRYKNYEIEIEGKNALIEEIESGSAGGTIGN
jgi:hypothetical protein